MGDHDDSLSPFSRTIGRFLSRHPAEISIGFLVIAMAISGLFGVTLARQVNDHERAVAACEHSTPPGH